MLDVTWRYDAAARLLNVEVEQTQDAVFRFQLDIGSSFSPEARRVPTLAAIMGIEKGEAVDGTDLTPRMLPSER